MSRSAELPRAELGDNGEDGEEVLYVAVRLAKMGKNDLVELILKKVAPEGARELDRAVTELLAVTELTELLRDFNLTEYAEAFVENGYDDLEYLRTLPPAELRSVAVDCGMKPGHAAKFVSWMPTGGPPPPA